MRVRGRSVARRTFQSLGNSAYRRFWFSLIVLMAGVNMQMLARGQLAWDLTNDTFMVALVGSAFAPPILIFSVFGGTFADRWDRKKMIQYSQFAISIVAGTVGVAIWQGWISIWFLMVAGFAQGVCWSFMMPARQSIIPQLVSKSEITNAIALSASGMALMTLSGPGLGGLAYAWLGPANTYFLITGLMLIAFVMMAGVKITGEAAALKRRQEAVLKEVWEGLQYSARNRTILILFVLLLATTMTSMSFRSLMPAQVEIIFGGGPRQLGILMSMIGVGALLGSLFIAGLTENMRRGVVLLAATGLSAAAILVSTFVSIFFIAMIAMMVLGLGDAGRRSLNAAMLMEQADEEHRGRVMGIYMLNFGLTPIGAIPLGILAEATDIRVAFAVAGCVLAAAVLLTWVLTPRIRRL
ncbi:MAG: MFS transporter [Chloroflexi bacterium]|nr:MFS transporter [Chloroflexota bacterium]